MLEQDEIFDPPKSGYSGDVPTGEVNPGDRIVYLLERLVEVQNGYPGIQPSLVAITASSISYTNRMRGRSVLISCDTAGAFTLNVGTTKYTFTMPANTTYQFDFPVVIENGVDVFLTGDSEYGAGVGRMWLIYTTE